MSSRADRGTVQRGTSYDVAREAGVSQSTVSRVFRPGTSVAPATRDRVMAAAARVGYRPNAIAASLITRRSHLVAVVISNLTNLHYPEVLAELTARLSAEGLRVLLFTLSTESEIDAVLDQVWRYRVDGAIVAARLSPGQEAAFAREGVPLVLYNRPGHGAFASSVVCEFAAGERMLVDGLIAAGRRRFGLIAGPADSAVGEARVAGAIACLAAAGLEPLGVERGDFSHASGMAATRRLLAAHRLDALIAANDVMALGALDTLRHEAGLAIPGDVAVVGFDGVAPAGWPAYQLTTVRQPVEAMTEAAVRLLLAQVADPARPAEQLRFAGTLVPGRTAPLT
ncbi:MAG: LacI family DNA-binding transcriptional regulator [Sphingomonadaceae bacterium]